MKGSIRMKHLHLKKATSILTALVIVFLLFATNLPLVNVHAAAIDKTVLWSGNVSVSGDWSDWTCAAKIKLTDQTIFNQKFDIQIKYSGDKAPYLIFMSWSGGKSWVELRAFYSSNGIAYYSYDSIKNALGDDLGKVDALRIYPDGADLTVTELAMCSPASSEDISVPYEGLAGSLAEAIGAGWNLGDTLDSCGDWIATSTDGSVKAYETAWSNPVTTKAMIQEVKAAGFNAIRVPVTWYQHMDDTNHYKVDKAWMDRVQETVDYVIDSGLICILNVHHDTGTDGWLRATESSYNRYADKFESLWTQIASRFKDYSNKLLFEGFNEMLDENNNWNYPGKTATAMVNKWNQLFVDTVRATGGNNANRCLIVNTYCADSGSAILDDFVLPADGAKNSLMVEVHYYSPYAFCTSISDSTQQDDWRTNDGETLVSGAMYSLYKHFTSQGIPVIIGELGAANKNNTENRVDYASYVVKTASKYGIKCFWWDDGGNHKIDPQYGFFTGMSIFVRNTLTWDFPEVRDALVNSVLDTTPFISPAATTGIPTSSEVPASSKTLANNKGQLIYPK